MRDENTDPQPDAERVSGRSSSPLERGAAHRSQDPASPRRHRSVPADALPASLARRYRADAELGVGSQARVVRAHDGFLHRDVAIKLFHPRSGPAERDDRRTDEARLLASLNHRALTTLYDAGTDLSDSGDPLVYLVMEYVRGPDLRQLLQTATLTSTQACWLGYDLDDALVCLHRAGFLHRDIKPANVLLTDHEPGVRPRSKLTDFGISALVSTRHRPGNVTGTPAYIAPEQVDDLPPTEASDIYSLGLVLIEAITGARAFPGSDREAAFLRLQRQPTLPDDLPTPLASLLQAMTARIPSDRPTAGQAAEQFRILALDEATRDRRQERADADRETARLAAVQRYHILDTPPEDAFDDLTALAAHVLHSPAAVVSITDRDRVWFKSRHDYSERQIDRDSALCTLTDQGTGAWTISDAAEDPRTFDNPQVTGGPRVRGYAAAPLRTHDGHVIGAFCVLDPRPHHYSQDDLDILESLAAVVMRELELRLASRRAVFNRRAADPARALPAATSSGGWDTPRGAPRPR